MPRDSKNRPDGQERWLKFKDLLVLEDDRLLARSVQRYLESLGGDVQVVGTVAGARERLKNARFDFLVLDVHLPDGEGLTLLEQGDVPETTETVIMTGEGGLDAAIRALRQGARDFLTKPFDVEELGIALRRSQRSGRIARIDQFAREKARTEEEGLFFGRGLAPVKQKLERVLEMESRLPERLPPVLLVGETGTGKSSLARWIHRNGARAEKPLIEVNCSTLPESLAESELFGHERGAFTDAKSARLGLFEAADGGTLFLDEIPSLSPGLQAKVLTAIEDGRIRRLGGTREIQVDVRIIAATNVDLPTQIASGAFREDLYHRLNLLEIVIPPLRERGDDLLELAEHLGRQLAARYRIEFGGFGPEQREMLLGQEWRGNVRELAHELERMLVFGGWESGPVAISAATGGQEILRGFRIPEEGMVLDDWIDAVIGQALERTEGNLSAAARLLGVKRDYVRYRLRKREEMDSAPDSAGK